MTDLFLTSMGRLQRSIVSMGELAGAQLGKAISAYVARDAFLAAEVLTLDDRLDALELEHEERVIQLIALNQPVARDLRLLIACLRANNDIEYVGDIAVNIAQSVHRLAPLPPMRPFVDIPQSYETARSMWDDSLRCLAELDVDLARDLRQRDDHMDALNKRLIQQLNEIAASSPEYVFQATNIIGISRSLEHVADIAVDIAEEVIFATRGEVLRHPRMIAG